MYHLDLLILLYHTSVPSETGLATYSGTISPLWGVMCLSTVSAYCTLFLQWLEKDFLGYLDEWEASVTERQKYTPEQKACGMRKNYTTAERHRMCLSQETLEGLRVTGIAV